MVCDHQNILIQALSRFKAQIVKVNQLQRMCGHDVFEEGLWLSGFEGKTWATLPEVLFSLGSHARPEHISEWIVVCEYIKGWPIQVLMEFLYHGPLEGEKLQLVCSVVGFSLGQASTGICYDCFSAILLSLIEDSPQTSATCISVKLECLSKIGIHKDRCHGTESLQVIKGLLSQLMAAFFLPTFSPDVSSCRGHVTCMNLGMNLQ